MATKICDECGKTIGIIGGSWEVNGKTVCTKCEQKLREASSGGKEGAKTVCDECGNPIGFFGGSWKIDGKTVCSTCEKKIRLDLKDEKAEEIPQTIQNKCSKCGVEISGDAKICQKCTGEIKKPEEIITISKTDDATITTHPSFKGEYEVVEETNEKKLVNRLDEYGEKNWEACEFTCFAGAMGRIHYWTILKHKNK